MLAGMPTHYHISCRVRSEDHGIDAQPTEQADTVIETNGTAWAALCIWLSNKDSWLYATPEAIKSLLECMRCGDLSTFGWDSHDAGGMTGSNDWETGDIEIDEEAHTVHMNGTACCSSFQFEVAVTPHDPSKVSSQEIAHTQEYTDARYLLALSERIMAIPVQYGTDQSDYDELRAIAARLDQQAVTDALNDT
jgi:hypothetical protein